MGMRNASADYIIFQNPNETLSPNACESLYDAIATENSDIATGITKKLLRC